MVADGHEILYIGPVAARQILSQEGLRVAAFLTSSAGLPLTSFKGTQSRALGPQRSRNALVRYLDAAVSDCERHSQEVARWAPDLILRDSTAYAGWLLSNALDRASVVFDFAPTPLPALERFCGDVLNNAQDAANLRRRPLRSIRGELHILAGPVGWFEDAVFDDTSRLYKPPPPMTSGAGEDPGNVVARPSAYVTMGTTYNGDDALLSMILTSLRRLEIAATVSTGGLPPGNGLALWVGDPLFRVQRFVHETALLSEVSVAICHGGYGTIMGCFSAGVPIIVIPQAAADHAANSVRVTRLNIGIVLKPAEPVGPQLESALCDCDRQSDMRTAIGLAALNSLGLPDLVTAAADAADLVG